MKHFRKFLFRKISKMTINARYLIPKFYTKTRQGIFLFCLSVHLQLVALGPVYMEVGDPR